MSTPHVEVLTDAGQAVGERVALRLEELRSSLATVTPALVVELAPVQVIVFKDKSLARAYAPNWRGVKDDVEGFFHAGPDRRRLLLVDDGGHTPSVAQHEFTHALLDAASPTSPLWLNEGLAEYFSTLHSLGGQARAGAAISTHVSWLEEHGLLPTTKLFAVRQGSPDYHEGNRRGTFYAQSWLLVHMLLSSDDGDPARLERVLVATREGEPFANAFRREFGDESALGPRLAAYLRQAQFEERDWSGPSRRQPRPAPTTRVRAKVPAEDVLASLGLGFLSRPNPRLEDAEEHLEEALELDEKHSEAWAGMGWLELLKGENNEARTWFERALESEPVSVAAAKVAASQLLIDVGRRQVRDERRDVGLFARRALERALVQAPADPDLLALLARSWVVWPEPDPKEGYALAVRAAAALPGRSDVQLDLLALAALTGREQEAQALARKHFDAATDPELHRSARSALLAGEVQTANRSIAAGDTAKASALLKAARQRVADDPVLTREADRYIELYSMGRAQQDSSSRESRAIDEFNAGVKSANASEHASAAASFRRAAELTAREELRTRATRMARRMEALLQANRGLELAQNRDFAGALAVLQSIDRELLEAEELRWLDSTVAQVKSDQQKASAKPR